MVRFVGNYWLEISYTDTMSDKIIDQIITLLQTLLLDVLSLVLLKLLSKFKCGKFKLCTFKKFLNIKLNIILKLETVKIIKFVLILFIVI